MAHGKAMLQCCGSDGDQLTVLEFFAVGKTARALLVMPSRVADNAKKEHICNFQGSNGANFYDPGFS